MKLNHFKESEFRGWYPYISPELLIRMDAMRGVLGYPIYVSPADGSIGRHGSIETGRSYHKYRQHGGVVKAIDVFPIKVEPEKWLKVARLVGIRGFGFYPQGWFNGRPHPRIHLDVRDKKGSWSVIDGEEQALSLGIAYWENNK